MQSVDRGVIEKIRMMVDAGVYTLDDMRIHLDQYVKSVFPPDQLPPQSNRRFYPLDQDIKNHIFLSIKRLV